RWALGSGDAPALQPRRAWPGHQRTSALTTFIWRDVEEGKVPMRETTGDVRLLREFDLDRLDRALARCALAATPEMRRLLDCATPSTSRAPRGAGAPAPATELSRLPRLVSSTAGATRGAPTRARRTSPGRRSASGAMI